MAEEKRKKQQMLMMGGAAVAVAALGYYYYSSRPSDQDGNNDATDTMDNGSKIEQITYDGDNNLNPIEEQPQSTDNANSYENERKSFEDEQDPIVDAMAADDNYIPADLEDFPDAATVDAAENKEVEDAAVPEVPAAVEAVAETVDADAESKEAVAETDAKKAKEAKEDSPVMVDAVEAVETVEPVEAAQPSAEQIEAERRAKAEAECKEAETRKLNERLQRYERVAERVAKCPTLQYKNGTLRINVLRATKVDKKDLGKKDFSDVFVKMEVPGSHFKQTTIQKDAVNPMWNESFELKVRDVYKDALKFTMMDHDTLVNDTIGTVEVPIIDIVAAQDSAVRAKGFRVKGSKTGCMLYVDVAYVEVPDKKK